MPEVEANRYPKLYNLLAAYLNQDYDLNGDSLDDAVQAFVDSAAPKDVTATRREIALFLNLEKDDLDGALRRLSFDHARDPAMPAADYLHWLDASLARPAHGQKR